ncbi:choline dehydrogenase [Geosmithia morbida]|uniref:Choline dehydrogenase n=1 Tax=Geosmithia morbida TaxID=1094350 RepID=A0A9P4Z4L0_9HYPO|nr:choline dehydrogenase [Geosmithia morbida]KAF4126554.1 choline dehydrogenase [Geosmithia morbida]
MKLTPSFLGAALAGTALSVSVPRSASHVIQDESSYDYIVIGSGPGGGPLAVNLATAGHSVLLLEAGKNKTDTYNQRIPVFFGEAQWDTEQGWWFYTKNYLDEEQNARSTKVVWEKPDGGKWVGLDAPEGSKQLGLWYPRAGTLGGCDTHNGGLTVRPSDWDWDNIKDITGDESWGHEHMLHYFQRIERNTYLPYNASGHGFSGYQPIGVGNKTLIEREPQVLAIGQASAAALGYEDRAASTDWDVVANWDINADTPDRDRQNDVYQIPFKRGENMERYSAGNRVNDGVRQKIPLTVQFDSFVTKVVLDSDNRATGVEYLKGEKLYRADPRSTKNSTGIPHAVRANKEVIVSGGTFNTPQILMHSGIGPADHLREHGIPVKIDLPGVGRNLQDHYEVPIIQELPKNFTFFGECTSPETVDSNPCFRQWREGGGPWATLGFFEFVLWTSSVAPRGERDIILYGTGTAVTGHVPPYTNATKLSLGSNYYTYTISESHPHNRAGRILLNSADPLDVPDINFEYFHDGGDNDIQAIVDAIEFTRKIFDSLPGGPNATLGEAFPGRHIKTQEQLRQYVRDEAYGHHASGTSSIGADDDPLAVLDSRFRVRGAKNLRVVDASVFPTTPGTFPLISWFMMSEKASDTILQDAADVFKLIGV